MMTASMRSRSSASGTILCLLLALVAPQAKAFLGPSATCRPFGRLSSGLAAEDTEKAAPAVTGADLEMMLQEWDTPLVVDAYATWYVSGWSAWCGAFVVARVVEEHSICHLSRRNIFLTLLFCWNIV